MTAPGPGERIFFSGGAPVPTDPTPTAPAPAHPRDTADLRELLRAAAATSTPLRLVGGGGWLDAGRPVHADRTVHLGALRGIVEYVPGDLTMTARAATPLADLQAAARAEGQFLPLDPWGGDGGTLGATLATATAGPLAGSLGLPRDVTLGVSSVSGTGELIRAGGRVVKNVAGFDLVRLAIGAWGTLGAITEATVRLRALPERELTLAIPIARATEHDSLLARLRAAPIAPLALELMDARMARLVGLTAPDDTLLVRLAGNATSVEAQLRALAGLGDWVEVDAGCWERLRADQGGAGPVIRLSAPATSFGALWSTTRTLLANAYHSPSPSPSPDGGVPVASANLMRGVARLQLPSMESRQLLGLLEAGVPAGVTLRGERLPPELWAVLDPGSVASSLARGVRHAFDPGRILNRGILGAEHDDVHRSTGSSTPPMPLPSPS